MTTYPEDRSPTQRLAWDTIMRRETRGIGIWQINPMEWRMIDRLAEVAEGSYRADPIPTYRRMLVNCGVCMVDQWIPTNPLSMGSRGYESSAAGGSPTTGMTTVVRDGIVIDSPKAVVEHMESVICPALQRQIAEFDPTATMQRLIEQERQVQVEIGPEMLKAPYTSPMARIPSLLYGHYGYENYFMAYALFPEVMEKIFALQADFAELYNRASARAIMQAGMAPYLRLDHDMTDDRGTLVDIRSLERIWFPALARSIRPFLEANITLVWHCDGNVSPMVPGLIEAGIGGFQGFQYEHGMDYEKICRMKTRDGDDLLIVAGVSVTRTLPFGTPDDIRREMAWLVRCGPRRGLLLGASSSIAPGVPWENLKALRDGFLYYRDHGRG